MEIGVLMLFGELAVLASPYSLGAYFSWAARYGLVE